MTVFEPDEPDVAASPTDEQDTDVAARSGDHASDIARHAEQELSALDGQPLAEHPHAYRRIHEALQRELAEITGA